MFFFFFFSSRRRHTRSYGDWSSDVCSSDLSVEALAEVWDQIYRFVWSGAPMALDRTAHFDPARGTRSFTEDPADEEFWPRSEERRVGKECRSRGSPEQ